MVFVNDGIEELQKVGIQNVSGEVPLYLTFAGSDNTATGSESGVVNSFISKDIVWSQSGIQSKYTAFLGSLDAVGSYIETLAIEGTTKLFAIDSSFLGLKTNVFNVQVEGEIIITRPN